jgi:hypothetical protein
MGAEKSCPYYNNIGNKLKSIKIKWVVPAISTIDAFLKPFISKKQARNKSKNPIFLLQLCQK